MKTSYYFVSIFVLVFRVDPGTCTCGGIGWTTYKSEKCFKIIDRLVNREQAEAICTGEVGGLSLVMTSGSSFQTTLSVASEEEQIFLSDLLYEQFDIVDSVWLGANRLPNGSFTWMDGTSLTYSNWAENFPSNDLDKGCMQMNSRLSKESSRADDGLWTDVSCAKRNLVVCQKAQTLSLEEVQKILFETVKHLEIVQEISLETIQQLEIVQNKSFETIKQLEIVQKNPVPIGFVYVELPNRPDPQMIWPNVVWQDVTSSYAGLFFRAGGGNAAPYTVIQSENSQKLNEVKHGASSSPLSQIVDMPANGDFSELVLAGLHTSGSFFSDTGLQFKLNSGEIRPRNTAVRIWTRTE